jgi:hypothetical protein
MTIATEELISWLGELDAALRGAEQSDEDDHLDALIDRGVTLLTTDAPVEAPAADPQVIDRVQRRLQAMADDIAAELASVRHARREVSRITWSPAVAS